MAKPSRKAPKLSPAEILRLRALPSEWAHRYRFIEDDMGRTNPIDFVGREWQRGILDDLSPRVVILKAAQMGLTELAMCRAMHSVDVLGKPCLYVFPTESDASDFSAARFDPMLDASPALAGLFTDVSNVGLKRVGNVPIYFRGSTSRGRLKSIPVAGLVLDEFDEMAKENVALARKRLLGQKTFWEWNLSTPRFPGVGVDEEFLASDRNRWFVPCPHCGHEQRITFDGNLEIPDNLEDIDSARFFCSACSETWTDEQRLAAVDAGRWVPENEAAPVRGYHISQLYSPSQTAPRIAGMFHEARRSASELEDFHNSVLGEPFLIEGLKISDSTFNDCVGDYPSHHSATGRPVAMGIDIGLTNHVAIVTQGQDGQPKFLRFATVNDWPGLSLLKNLYSAQAVVVDAQPERSNAHDFREAFRGEAWLAFYARTEVMGGEVLAWKDDNGTVSIHRTALADRLASAFGSASLSIPRDHPLELRRHCLNVYRSVEVAKDGNPRAVWRTRDGGDHFFHAMIYALAALERIADDGQAFEFESDSAWNGGGGFDGVVDFAWG